MGEIMKEKNDDSPSVFSDRIKKNKIGIIIAFFGEWPVWYDLFMHSVKKNESIDFIFFTDCPLPSNFAANIKYNFISFQDYCNLVSKRLGIQFNPTNNYKLCDLKPFLGFIHKDILIKYDFWGYCDVDMVLGNILDFYNDDLLEKYDVFSTHNDRLSGHFAVIRNNEKYTGLCFKIKNWKNKLWDIKHYGLDESDFSNLIFPESRFIRKFYMRIMMKILHWKTAWELYYSLFPTLGFILRLHKRRLYFKEQHTTPILATDGKLYKYESDTWFYNNGRVYNNRVNKDYIYLHFMILKKNIFREDHFWKEKFYKIPPDFDFSTIISITKQGISIYNIND